MAKRTFIFQALPSVPSRRKNVAVYREKKPWQIYPRWRTGRRCRPHEFESRREVHLLNTGHRGKNGGQKAEDELTSFYASDSYSWFPESLQRAANLLSYPEQTLLCDKISVLVGMLPTAHKACPRTLISNINHT